MSAGPYATAATATAKAAAATAAAAAAAAAVALAVAVAVAATPSPGRLRLAAQLAAADDAALGSARGAAELAPYFVLLHRLAAVPHYAATMSPAITTATTQAAAGAAAAMATAAVADGMEHPAPALEKLLLRLSLLSAVIAAAPTNGSAKSADRVVAPLLSHLLTIAQSLHTAESASASPPPPPPPPPPTLGAAAAVQWGDPTAGAYTRQLFSSTLSKSDKRSHPKHAIMNPSTP